MDTMQGSAGTSSPRRGPWSPAEDQRLLALIEDHGPSNWVRISQLLATRTPKQCRERFHQNLKPTLNHEPITDEEGLFIEQLVAQYGKKWAEIARHLNGRSDNAVKNWWNGGANRRRRASLAIDGSSPQHQSQHQPPPPPQHHPMQYHPQVQAGGYHHGPPPPPPPLQQQQQMSMYHPHQQGAPPPPPPPPPPQGMYQYPSVGHRVSLPNIHHSAQEYQQHSQRIPPGAPPSQMAYGPPPQQHHVQAGLPPPPPQTQAHQPPGVVFNSAYTSDSSGFGRSLSVGGPSHSVDPHSASQQQQQQQQQQHQQQATSPRPAVQHHSNTTPSPFGRRRATQDEAFPNTPYSRRVSANTTSTGYSSSRASSIGGVSSASDNEDPLHSLSKYSLSQSTSRRNSAQPPIDNILPPLGSPTATNGSTPSYQYGGYHPPRIQPVGTPPPPLFSNYSQRSHSVAGYSSSSIASSATTTPQSPRMMSISSSTVNASNATSKLAAETNTNINNDTTPTVSSDEKEDIVKQKITEDHSNNSTTNNAGKAAISGGEKLKISNLLS